MFKYANGPAMSDAARSWKRQGVGVQQDARTRGGGEVGEWLRV